jgi:hypothetical protein
MTYVSNVLDHVKYSSMNFNCKAKDMATPVQQPQAMLLASVSTLSPRRLWGPLEVDIDQGHAPPNYHSLRLFLSISSTNVWIIVPFGNPNQLSHASTTTIHNFLESNEKGPHLDEHKKDRHVNVDNSIWPYPT